MPRPRLFSSFVPVPVFSFLALCSLFLAPPVRAQESFRTQRSLRGRPAQSSTTTTSRAASFAHPHPSSFRGWHQAAKQGPDVVRHFQQLAHPSSLFGAVARQFNNSVTFAGTGSSKIFSKAAATSSPTSHSGILLRPSLPAGALPSGVVTGDFNGDGKI